MTRTVSSEKFVSPPVISMIASPIAAYDAVTSIEWSATGARKCSASGDWRGEKPISGNESVGPLQKDTAYTLRCEGDGGEASRTVEIVVTAEESGAGEIISGFFDNLFNAIGGIFSGGREEPPPSAPEIVQSAQKQSPKLLQPETPLKATSGSRSAPQVIFSVTPIVKLGETATIRWNAFNVTSCVAGGGWSGGKPLEGEEISASLLEDTSYWLECSGKGGTASSTVTAVVYSEEDGLFGKTAQKVSENFDRVWNAMKSFFGR